MPNSQSRRDPLLLEVNFSSGLEGIEETTNVDIASAIINFVEQQVGKKSANAPQSR